MDNLSDPLPQGMNQPPDNHLTEAILVAMFCCIPLGVVGICKACAVDTLLAAGQKEAAKKASEDAWHYTLWGFILGVVFWLAAYTLHQH